MSTFIANLAVVLDRIGSLIRSSRGDIVQTDDTTTRILEAEMSSNVETSNIGSLQRQADQLAVSRKHFVNMRKQQSMVLFTMHTHDMKRAAHVVISGTKARGGRVIAWTASYRYDETPMQVVTVDDIVLGMVPDGFTELEAAMEEFKKELTTVARGSTRT